jgi:hypothetical protein
MTRQRVLLQGCCFKGAAIREQLYRVEEFFDIDARTQRIVPLDAAIKEESAKHKRDNARVARELRLPPKLVRNLIGETISRGNPGFFRSPRSE